jgi:hypothetical protein
MGRNSCCETDFANGFGFVEADRFMVGQALIFGSASDHGSFLRKSEQSEYLTNRAVLPQRACDCTHHSGGVRIE